MTFITKRKYYNKPKMFITKNILTFILLKKLKELFLLKGSERGKEEWQGRGEWKGNRW